MCVLRWVAAALMASTSLPISAQQLQPALDQLAAAPLVTVHISEQLRSPPDEATITASTEATEPSATAALASDKAKTEQLIQAIRRSGIAAKDIQTEGVSVAAHYELNTGNGRSSQRLLGYSARNTVRIKTRDIDRLAVLLDALVSAGASNVYGPQFSISDPAHLRTEARRRGMVRGEAEATEYARNAGFSRVQLLSVEEGLSQRTQDVVITGSSMRAASTPPPPIQTVSAPVIQPGQIETGVNLTLRYRMAR